MAAGIQLLSTTNIGLFTELSLALWPECTYEEAFISWRQLIGTKDNYCALVEYNQEAVGFIHAAIRSDYVEGSSSDKTAYLEAIYIKPVYRKRHLASYLLKDAEKWVKLSGLNQIASDTELENTISQHFHIKSGFKEVNKIICYLKDLQ